MNSEQHAADRRRIDKAATEVMENTQEKMMWDMCLCDSVIQGHLALLVTDRFSTSGDGSQRVFKMKPNVRRGESLSTVSTSGPAEKASTGYYSPFKTQTLTHSWLSGNRQRVLIGREEQSLLRGSTSLQATRLADLICEGCALIAGVYTSLLLSLTQWSDARVVLLHVILPMVKGSWITNCDVTQEPHMNTCLSF